MGSRQKEGEPGGRRKNEVQMKEVSFEASQRLRERRKKAKRRLKEEKGKGLCSAREGAVCRGHQLTSWAASNPQKNREKR